MAKKSTAKARAEEVNDEEAPIPETFEDWAARKNREEGLDADGYALTGDDWDDLAATDPNMGSH